MFSTEKKINKQPKENGKRLNESQIEHFIRSYFKIKFLSEFIESFYVSVSLSFHFKNIFPQIIQDIENSTTRKTGKIPLDFKLYGQF